MIEGEIQKHPAGTYLLVAQDQLTVPKENTDVLVDEWFPVDDQGRIAFFQMSSPWTDCLCAIQGSRDRRIVEMLAKKYSPWHTEIVQVPVVYVPRCRKPGHR